MIWRRARPASILTYKAIVKALLARHNLQVPENTSSMLVKTVMSSRRAKKLSGGRNPIREQLRTALTHVHALLRYTEKRPTRFDSIKKRSKTLREALDSPEAVVWLGVAVPAIDVPGLLHRLDVGTLNGDELTSLAQAIGNALSTDGARAGRPMERSTSVVRAGCIAWFRGHRKDSYNTWSQDFSNAPLAKFLRDLLSNCWLHLSDVALYSAAKTARRDLRNRITEKT